MSLGITYYEWVMFHVNLLAIQRKKIAHKV